MKTPVLRMTAITMAVASAVMIGAEESMHSSGKNTDPYKIYLRLPGQPLGTIPEKDLDAETKPDPIRLPVSDIREASVAAQTNEVNVISAGQKSVQVLQFDEMQLSLRIIPEEIDLTRYKIHFREESDSWKHVFNPRKLLSGIIERWTTEPCENHVTLVAVEY